MQNDEKNYQEQICELVELLLAKNELIEVLQKGIEYQRERVEMYKEYTGLFEKPKPTQQNTNLKIVR